MSNLDSAAAEAEVDVIFHLDCPTIVYRLQLHHLLPWWPRADEKR